MNKQSQIRLYVGLIFGIIFLSVIYLNFISAPISLSNLNRLDNSGWKITKSTGDESNLTFWVVGSSKKTELGWITPNNNCIGWTDKYLYNKNGTRIKDDKNKDILLKCETSKCGGSNCYHISLTNAQAVNINNYIRLGGNSSVAEYVKGMGDALIYANNITTTFQHTRAGIGSNEFIVTIKADYNMIADFSILPEELNPNINTIQKFKLTNLSHPFIDYYECNHTELYCINETDMNCTQWENRTIFGKHESCGNFTDNNYYEEFLDYNLSYINLTTNEQTFKIIESHLVAFSSSGLFNVVLNDTEFWDKSNSSWFNNSWNYRKNISVQNANMQSNLTDFPLYVYFSDSDIGGRALPSGNDIRFAQVNSSGDATEVFFEKENFSISGGVATGYFWVRTNLTNTSNGASVIQIYYGNGTASAGLNGENKKNTWNSAYISVWHFNEPSWSESAGEVKDSKGVNNGTSSGAPYQATGTGFLYKGAVFNGINNTINITATNMPIAQQNITVSCLANATSNGDLFSRWGSTGSGTWRSDWILEYESTGYNFNNIPGGTAWAFAGITTASKNKWYYVAGTSNTTQTNGIFTYVNSSRTAGTQSYSTQGVYTSLAVIGAEWKQSGGANTGYQFFFNGTLDECRVSNQPRTQQWLRFEYENIFQGDNELTWGAEESQTAEDTIYPLFSGYWDNNASLIDSGTGYFNVTVENTNGTVILHLGSNNVYATNLTSNVYNASITFTESGTYSYNWTAYGNGSSKNLNTSEIRSYTVNASNSYSQAPNLSLTFTAPLTKLSNLSKKSTLDFLFLSTINRISSLTSKVTQEININNLISKFFGISKSITQTLNIDALSSRVLGAFKSIQQLFSIDNLVARLTSIFKSNTQTLLISPSVSESGGMIRTSTQSITIGNLVSNIGNFFKSTSQTFNIDALTSRLSNSFKSIQQNININIITSRISSFFRSFLDLIRMNLDTSYTASGVTSFSANLSQSISTNIIIDRIGGINRFLSQTFNLDALVSRLSKVSSKITQSLSFEALSSKISGLSKLTSQTLSINAFTDRIRGINLQINQSFSFDAVVSRLGNFFRNILQGINYIAELIFPSKPVTTTPGSGHGEYSYFTTPIYIRLCNLTYEMARDNITYEFPMEEFSGDLVRFYIDNWQIICSDTLNKTLQPEFVCQKIYYASINNKNFNQTKEEIETKINISTYLLAFYINNYNTVCYENGYSDKISEPLRIINISEAGETMCGQQEGMYLPFFPISFGTIDCQKLKDWNWIFKFDTSNGNLKVIGIQVWIVLAVLCLLIALIILVIYRMNGRFKRFLIRNSKQ